MTETIPVLRINGIWTQWIKPLRHREPFRTGGNMHGEVTVPDGSITTGRLPAEWITSAKLADYVVYSWQTPIAWHRPAGTLGADDAGEWIMPDLYYSNSTCKQAGRIRTALSVLDDPSYRDEPPARPQRRRRRTRPVSALDVPATAAVVTREPASRIPAGRAPDRYVFGDAY